MTSIRFAPMMVEQHGSGDPVVLLHGLGGTSNSWQALMPALAGRRIIRPDLPGSGRSPVPSGALTVAGMARQIISVLGELGVDRIDLVGHSFGSLIAFEMAGYRPSLVRSLAVFGPIHAPGDAIRTRLIARAALARDQGMCTVIDQLLPVALAAGSDTSNPVAHAFVRESHMRQDREGFAKSCEALASASAVELSQIECPVLAVSGDQDGVGPPSVAEDIADRVRTGRCRVVPDCGHWTPIEKPQACADALAAFLCERA